MNQMMSSDLEVRPCRVKRKLEIEKRSFKLSENLRDFLPNYELPVKAYTRFIQPVEGASDESDDE